MILNPRYVSTLVKRRVWRYHRGNQNSYIVEKQTRQWPKEKVQKKKQRSTKHIHVYKSKDRVTWIPLKSGGELRCSGRVSSSCSTSDFNSTKGNPLQTLLTMWPAGLYMNEELGQVNQEVYTKSSMLRSCNITIGFQFRVRLVLLYVYLSAQ
jgi:hypothetical protein